MVKWKGRNHGREEQKRNRGEMDVRQKRIKYDKMLLRLKSSLGSVPGGKTQPS